MGLLEAFWLGVLQGLTEFLPVSSSGHLALLKHFLGVGNAPVFFDIMLHMGTLGAIVVFYRKTLWSLVRGVIAGSAVDGSQSSFEGKKAPAGLPARRTLWLLILATLPAAAVGLAFRPISTSSNQEVSASQQSWRQRVGGWREHAGQRPWLVLGFLSCTSVVLLAGGSARPGTVDANSMHWRHAVGIGLAQACSALCPGLSRAGMTVSSGLALGLRGEWAVHFSLLMAIPIFPAAAALKACDIDPAWLTTGNLLATALGTAVSAAVGWCCILLLLGSVRRGRWWWFSIYLWMLVAAVGGFLLNQAT